MNDHMWHVCLSSVCPVMSGCVGRKPPHVQETQVEAGRSGEASEHNLTNVRSRIKAEINSGCFVDLRANSVTWNPHKMMSVPLQCSALLVREEVGHISFYLCAKLRVFVLLCRLQTFWIWFTGSDAELQPDARLLPVPAGQTLWPVLRHRRQSAAVWAPRRHLQAVAHVES